MVAHDMRTEDAKESNRCQRNIVKLTSAARPFRDSLDAVHHAVRMGTYVDDVLRQSHL
jgi:hypothetical protein